MKLKKVMSVLLSSLMFMSIAAVPAFAANTKDTEFYFYWNFNKGDTICQTSYRNKENNTPLYIKATPNTLPVGGFYVDAIWSDRGEMSPGTDSIYLVNDYYGHTIRFNFKKLIGKNMTGKDVGMQGFYDSNNYSWGDVHGVWSPDTWNPQNYASLN